MSKGMSINEIIQDLKDGYDLPYAEKKMMYEHGFSERDPSLPWGKPKEGKGTEHDDE